MEIKVKLFATLRNDREKETVMIFPQGATVTDIIQKLNISKEEVAILLINGNDGDFVVALEDGDTVSIFPPIGGG